ncbi:MAG: hypothetical protein MJY72_04740 [Bacteroidales bacterium]|nr:hypothetical protein [Bacteroidales bacterium]
MKMFTFRISVIIVLIFLSTLIRAQGIDGVYRADYDEDYDIISITIHQGTFKYELDFGAAGGDILTECSIKQVEDDVYELCSNETGLDYVDRTVVSANKIAYEQDFVRILIDMPHNRATGKVVCEYVYEGSDTILRTESVSDWKGTIIIPTIGGKSIAIRNLFYMSNYIATDWNDAETAPTIIRTFLLKAGDKDPLSLKGGTEVTVSSNDITNEQFFKNNYNGEYILITPSGLRWRGRNYVKVDNR